MLLTGLSSKTDTYVQFLTILLLFIFVLLITWWTTKWIAKIQKGQMANGTNLEIIETTKISPDKYIQLVRTGEKYIVIAVGKSEVHMLTELNPDEVIIEDNNDNTMDFKTIFDKVKNFNKNSNNEENM